MNNQRTRSDLCKLGQSDDKTEKEFGEILSFLTLKDGEGVAMYTQCNKEPARLREDKVEKSLEKSVVLALAPKQEKGYIQIPRALEEV